LKACWNRGIVPASADRIPSPQGGVTTRNPLRDTRVT
jgi:hypothetical protein